MDVLYEMASKNKKPRKMIQQCFNQWIGNRDYDTQDAGIKRRNRIHIESIQSYLQGNGRKVESVSMDGFDVEIQQD